jgi:hypothetical protein
MTKMNQRIFKQFSNGTYQRSTMNIAGAMAQNRKQESTPWSIWKHIFPQRKFPNIFESRAKI